MARVNIKEHDVRIKNDPNHYLFFKKNAWISVTPTFVFLIVSITAARIADSNIV